jgi:DNA-binding LacI/PurR family transcriptional regulator
MAPRDARRTTIIDVARKAGVAISSASAALNGRPGVSDATRERILRIADDLGYVPSLRGRSLSSNRAFQVGLVVQRDLDILEADPFFGAFMGGVVGEIEPRGYALVLQMSTTPEETERHFRSMAANLRVDGVFIDDIRHGDPRIGLMQELRLPAVAVNADPDFPLPAVRQDASRAIGALTRHLIGLGHTRIAHVSGPGGYIHSTQRMIAWQRALEEAGLPRGPLYEGDFGYRSGEAAADALMGSPEAPTAVVCANDLMATGFVRECQDIGLRVPLDVSVTGFDGIALGTYIRPRLTTASTDPRLLGSTAARMLLDLIETGGVEDRSIAPARPVIRESTAAPAR